MSLVDLQKEVYFSEFWLQVKKDKRDWQIPECPCCGEEHHIKIRIDRQGNADAVECESCGWDDYSSHESRMLEVKA